MSYQLNPDYSIRRLSDGATIPADVNNVDYQEYLRWVSAGNEPLDPTVTEPSPDFQRFLDLILVSGLYQNIVLQATTNQVVNTGLTLTMGNLLLAVTGKPNVTGLQVAINLLFSGLTYSPAQAAELESILGQSNLTGLVTIPQP